MARVMAKYGSTSAPTNILAAAAGVASAAISAATAADDQSGTVAAFPEAYDSEYLCPVTVGAQTLMLDFDTGSSDLWVFSTLTPSAQSNGQTPYDTSSGVATGQNWTISYGDGSRAGGQVFADKVVVGAVTATSMAVEAATSVTNHFSTDTNNDGLLGLGFGSLNTCKSSKCTTFFDTVKSTLASALFTVTLKRHAAGSYDFGYIDASKYTGSITYAPVTASRGYWSFSISGYSVGSNASTIAYSVIADTGTTLIYMPNDVVAAYYAQVPGSQNLRAAGGYIFPCAATLPDMSFMISGYAAVVPGSFFNYSPYGETTCFGGLQSSAGVGINILGDIFLKSQFVVFDQSQASPRLGFAAQAGLAYPAPVSSASASSVVASTTSSPVASSTSFPVASSTSTSLASSTSTSTRIVITSTITSTTTATATATPTPSSAPTTSSLSCPSSNGTTYTTPSGTQYIIECAIDHPGGDLALIRTATLDLCINTCSTTASCVAVSWVPAEAPGHCYMHFALTSAVSNNGVWGAVLKSASPAPAPPASTTTTSPTTTPTQPPATPLSCPASNGQRVTSGSQTFRIECGIDHAGGDVSMTYTPDLEGCVAACAGLKGCVAASWVLPPPQLQQGSWGPCYLKNSLTAGVQNGGVWGVVVDV